MCDENVGGGRVHDLRAGIYKIPALDPDRGRGIHSSELHTSLISDRSLDPLYVEAAALLGYHYYILFDSFY